MKMQMDKLLHLVCSYAILLTLYHLIGLLLAVVLTVVIGLLKEIYDAKFESGFSIGDIVFNIIGVGLAGVFILLII